MKEEYIIHSHLLTHVVFTLLYFCMCTFVYVPFGE